MARSMTNGLVHAVDAHFETLDSVVGGRIVAWIEDSGLDLREARVLLALAEGGPPRPASEIAERSGLPLDSVYKAVHSLHGRGLTQEDSRDHSLSARGRALMSSLTEARREAVEAYVAQLGPDERERLERVLGQPGVIPAAN
jgi:DNA-binding MarR family transcriptional regulator